MNMAGKSTFLRTLGVNALLAQTLFTCACARYEASPLRVLSSMAIVDSLAEGESLFLAEARRLLDLVRRRGRRRCALSHRRDPGRDQRHGSGGRVESDSRAPCPQGCDRRRSDPRSGSGRRPEADPGQLPFRRWPGRLPFTAWRAASAESATRSPSSRALAFLPIPPGHEGPSLMTWSRAARGVRAAHRPRGRRRLRPHGAAVLRSTRPQPPRQAVRRDVGRVPVPGAPRPGGGDRSPRGAPGRWPWATWLLLPWAACLLFLAAVGALALEGLICIVMAAPVFLVLASVGGIVTGLLLQRDHRYDPASPSDPGAPSVVSVTDRAAGTVREERRRVETSVRIRATPEVVWKNVVRCRRSGATSCWSAFRALGIPLPVEATLDREGTAPSARPASRGARVPRDGDGMGDGSALGFDIAVERGPSRTSSWTATWRWEASTSTSSTDGSCWSERRRCGATPLECSPSIDAAERLRGPLDRRRHGRPSTPDLRRHPAARRGAYSLVLTSVQRRS